MINDIDRPHGRRENKYLDLHWTFMRCTWTFESIYALCNGYFSLFLLSFDDSYRTDTAMTPTSSTGHTLPTTSSDHHV